MIAIDTNILVYAFDTSYPEKREKCKKIIQDIFDGKQEGALTNQILAEFTNVVLKKIEKPLTKGQVKTIIGAITSCENYKIYNYNQDTLLKSLNLNSTFWDALIIQTLKDANVHKIITENTKDFIDKDIEVENPFNN